MSDEREHVEDRGISVGILTDRVDEVTCGQCGCEIDVADLESFVRVECPDCGNIEIVPAKLGQFLLLDLIGAGGMGGVYYAKDETLGRFVAIKVMLQSLGSDLKFVENFKREAQAAARLNHPNIVQIYSFGQEKGQPYIVMELVSGSALDKMMDPGCPVSPVIAMQVGLDISEGLMAADEAGLIHGDIKPENILFDEKRRAKLVDFGIASFAKQSSVEGGIWGTPYYIAPEKVKRQTVDARSDIYSLGATLYHALAGQPPFEGETPMEVVKARLQRPPKPLSALLPHIDRQVERIVMRMLQAEPSMRYPTYASLIGDLKKIVKSLGGGRRGGPLKTSRIMVPKRMSGQIPAVRDDEPVARGKTARTARTARSGASESGPRIVVHKRGGATSPSPLAEYKTRSTGGVAAPQAAGEPVVRRRKKKKSKGGKWAFAIVFVLACVGGLAFFVKHRHDEKIAQRRERVEIADHRQQADQVLVEIQGQIQGLTDLIAKGADMRRQATNAVYVVLGEPLVGPAKPDLKEKPAEAKPVADSGAAAQREPAAARRAGDAPPAGEPTREELERRRQMQAERLKAPPPPPPPPPEDDIADELDEADEEPDEPPPPSEPEIRVLARKTLETVDRIDAYAERVETLEASAAAVKNSMANVDSSAMSSGFLVQMKDFLRSAGEMETAIQTLLKEAEKVLTQVLDIEQDVVATREAERKAKEDADRMQREARERQEQERLYKAKMEAELQSVSGARLQNQLMARQHQFKDIVEAFKKQFTDLETREGRAAAETLIEQYSRMADLKAFIVQQLNRRPYSWGWLRPKQDVLGATDKGVRLQGALIPWSEVGAPQMIRFIDHYVDHRQVSLRDQAEHSFNAAIYCLETGGDTDSARNKAIEYLRKAVQLRPNLETEARRLLPTLSLRDDF